jgi:hypothetical protein
MENILDGVNTSDMTAQATNIISAFSPYLALIVGILLAFLVISYLISALTGKKRDDTPDVYDKNGDFDDDDPENDLDKNYYDV